MPLQPVIRSHTFGTPVNTPNAGTPEDSCLEPPRLSDTLANSSFQRIGGGYETTRLAAGMEMERLQNKNQFRGMDDQSVNTTLVNYLDHQHRTDDTNAHAASLMDPRSRNTHFVQVYEQSHHEWHDRNSPSRAATAAAASASLLNASNNTTAAMNASGRGGRAGSALSRTINASALGRSTAGSRRSASASGYRNKAPTGVKGLFVAFADSAVEEQILNLSREVDNLQVEKENDHYAHRTELARLLSENNKLKAENDEMKARCDNLGGLHEKELKEMRVLKEEYENRYRAQLEENKVMQQRMAAAEETAQRLQDTDGSRQYQLQSLQFQLQEAQGSLRRAENQAGDSSKRAREVFDEKELLRKKSEDMDKERKAMTEMMDVKERIIAGLEKELAGAQEKLSSIAFFKESYGGRGPSAASGATGAQKKSKLYDKYFGRR